MGKARGVRGGRRYWVQYGWLGMEGVMGLGEKIGKRGRGKVRTWRSGRGRVEDGGGEGGG